MSPLNRAFSRRDILESLGLAGLAFHARRRGEIALRSVERHLLGEGRVQIIAACSRHKGTIPPAQHARGIAQPHRKRNRIRSSR